MHEREVGKVSDENRRREMEASKISREVQPESVTARTCSPVDSFSLHTCLVERIKDDVEMFLGDPLAIICHHESQILACFEGFRARIETVQLNNTVIAAEFCRVGKKIIENLL